MNNNRSITKLITSHTIPTNIPSLINSLLIFPRYLTEKNTTVNVKTTGIIDSNKGLLEDLNGNMKNEIIKGISHIKKPNSIIVFQFLLDIKRYPTIES